MQQWSEDQTRLDAAGGMQSQEQHFLQVLLMADARVTVAHHIIAGKSLAFIWTWLCDSVFASWTADQVLEGSPTEPTTKQH